MDEERIIKALDSVILFLSENEQYGDDWQEEIECLNYLIDYLSGNNV